MTLTHDPDPQTTAALDGYSEGYRALVQGATTGKVSFPASRVAGLDEQQIFEAAQEALRNGPSNCWGLGRDAKVLRRADVIR